MEIIDDIGGSGVSGGVGSSISGIDGTRKSLYKICSPAVRRARNSDSEFIAPLTFISSGSQIIIILKRSNSANADDEFVEGAFMFHDGRYRLYIILCIYMCIWWLHSVRITPYAIYMP